VHPISELEQLSSAAETGAAAREAYTDPHLVDYHPTLPVNASSPRQTQVQSDGIDTAAAATTPVMDGPDARQRKKSPATSNDPPVEPVSVKSVLLSTIYAGAGALISCCYLESITTAEHIGASQRVWTGVEQWTSRPHRAQEHLG